MLFYVLLDLGLPCRSGRSGRRKTGHLLLERKKTGHLLPGGATDHVVLEPMSRITIDCMGRGQHSTLKVMDISTTRLTQPRGPSQLKSCEDGLDSFIYIISSIIYCQF